MNDAGGFTLRRLVVLIAGTVLCCALAFAGAPADTLPDRYSDAEFWRLVTDFSEPDGMFPYENFVSNEATYQVALPELQQKVKPGGAIWE
jgi:hypothetical protein